MSGLHEARALADKLSSECRDSPYRPLAAHLRSVRNLLEDIEDTLDDAGPTASAQGPVWPHIAHTHAVLAQVASAVRRTSGGQGDDSVLGFATPIVCQGLLEDTMGNLARARDVVVTLEKSHASHSEAPGPMPQDEDMLPAVDSSTKAHTWQPSRWSSIYFDPLSTPIELATSIILSDEPDPRPRAHSTSMQSMQDMAAGPPADDRESSGKPLPIPATGALPTNGPARGTCPTAPSLDRAAEAPELSHGAQGNQTAADARPPAGHSAPASPYNLGSKSLSPLPPRQALSSSPQSPLSSRSSSDRYRVAASRYRIVNPDPPNDEPKSTPLSEGADVPFLPRQTIALPDSDSPKMSTDSNDVASERAPVAVSPLPVVLITEHVGAPPDILAADARVQSSSTPSLTSVSSDPSLSAIADLNTARHLESSEHQAATESSAGLPPTGDGPGLDLTLHARSHRSGSMPNQPLRHTLANGSPVSPNLELSPPQRRMRSQSDLNTSTALPRASVDTLYSTKSEQHFAQRPKTEMFGVSGTNVQPASWNSGNKDITVGPQLVQYAVGERAYRIVESWNRCHWDMAERYLTSHLSDLMDAGEKLAERRARHLLGVCASFQGQSSKAIEYFLSVLRVPVLDVDDLDVGDCAAAYWLADEYTLLNRRAEALLAYSIAERSPLYQEGSNARLSQCIWAERRNCLRGVGRSDFKQYLIDDGSTVVAGGQPGASLLEPATIGPASARALLDIDMRKSPKALMPTFELDPNSSRAATLSALHSAAYGDPSTRYYGIKITADMLFPGTYWPMAYDPFYCSANVARGRLLLNESDMLRVFTTMPDAKLPRSGPLDVGRKDCFSCADLGWLIGAIRTCLQILSMEWSEVASVEGTWFVVRYASVDQLVRVATTHYFVISLFRHSLRSGYGCEICPDGSLSASRIVGTDASFQRGVPVAEPKRLRKLIRELLDEQAKQRPRSKRQSAFGVLVGMSDTSAHSR